MTALTREEAIKNKVKVPNNEAAEDINSDVRRFPVMTHMYMYVDCDETRRLSDTSAHNRGKQD